jgi:membrane-associated phospholipid phosphatase
MKQQQKVTLLVILVIVLAFILSLVFDHQILNFFLMLRTKTGISLDFVEKDIIIYPAILFIQLIFILIDSNGFKKGKKQILYFIMSLIITVLISTLLRAIIPRERPFPSQHQLGKEIFLDKNSFPSGHTAFTFTLFPFIKNKVLVWIWTIVAIFIMISRLWNGMHYPSDVIAGAVLGYLIPFTFLKIMKKIK